jgi:hypothetical protein
MGREGGHGLGECACVGCALRFLSSQARTFHRLPNIGAQHLRLADEEHWQSMAP